MNTNNAKNDPYFKNRYVNNKPSKDIIENFLEEEKKRKNELENFEKLKKQHFEKEQKLKEKINVNIKETKLSTIQSKDINEDEKENKDKLLEHIESKKNSKINRKKSDQKQRKKSQFQKIEKNSDLEKSDLQFARQALQNINQIEKDSKSIKKQSTFNAVFKSKIDLDLKNAISKDKRRSEYCKVINKENNLKISENKKNSISQNNFFSNTMKKNCLFMNLPNFSRSFSKEKIRNNNLGILKIDLRRQPPDLTDKNKSTKSNNNNNLIKSSDLEEVPFSNTKFVRIDNKGREIPYKEDLAIIINSSRKPKNKNNKAKNELIDSSNSSKQDMSISDITSHHEKIQLIKQLRYRSNLPSIYEKLIKEFKDKPRAKSYNTFKPVTTYSQIHSQRAKKRKKHYLSVAAFLNSLTNKKKKTGSSLNRLYHKPNINMNMVATPAKEISEEYKNQLNSIFKKRAIILEERKEQKEKKENDEKQKILQEVERSNTVIGKINSTLNLKKIYNSKNKNISNKSIKQNCSEEKLNNNFGKSFVDNDELIKLNKENNTQENENKITEKTICKKLNSTTVFKKDILKQDILKLKNMSSKNLNDYNKKVNFNEDNNVYLINENLISVSLSSDRLKYSKAQSGKINEYLSFSKNNKSNLLNSQFDTLIDLSFNNKILIEETYKKLKNNKLSTESSFSEQNSDILNNKNTKMAKFSRQIKKKNNLIYYNKEKTELISNDLIIKKNEMLKNILSKNFYYRNFTYR